MNTVLSFVSSVRTTAFALGIAVAAIACTNGGAEDTAESGAAATNASAPATAQEVSNEGRAAAAALLHMSALLIADQKMPEVAAYRDFVLTQSTEAFILDRGTAGRTFFFDGHDGPVPLHVGVEGAMFDATLHLVVEESWANPKWGPSYSAKLTNDPRPAAARKVEGVHARALSAIQGLAAMAIYDAANPNLAELKKFAAYDVMLDKLTVTEIPNGDATYALEGLVIEGGDMIVGSATMTIHEKHDNTYPKLNIVHYTAQAERTTL